MPKGPAMATRRRMSMGCSGLALPGGASFPGEAVNEAPDVRTDAKAQVAATKVQAIQRGRLSRKPVSTRPAMRSAFSSSEQDVAASKVQANIRGRNVRKQRANNSVVAPVSGGLPASPDVITASLTGAKGRSSRKQSAPPTGGATQSASPRSSGQCVMS